VSTVASNLSAVFAFDGSTGQQQIRPIPDPTPPQPSSLDDFGRALAASAFQIVVGDPLDGLSDDGKVYIFSAADGSLLFTLSSPTPEPGGNFGQAVALVGNLIAVGAPDEDSASGHVHLFDSATGIFQRTIFNPPHGGGRRDCRRVGAQ
jgi:hypothetical protein